MFRRRTRNSTAYTGVGQSTPSAQQPNTNAMAAALTIGENLRETQPAKYGTPRTQSLQKQLPQTRSTGSLLKRSPSIQAPGLRPPTTRSSRAGSNASRRLSSLQSNTSGQRMEYSVDDSFNDSFLEQMGRDADVHYSNRATMEDVKLEHKPAPKPAVRMVKKYIPTPNGIKVIEVPEATMKQEIARSNSMRSGMAIGRSPLMQKIPRSPLMQKAPRSVSLNSSPRAVGRTGRQGGSRLLSLVNPNPISENAEEETRAGRIDEAKERQRERDRLQAQIEDEKHLAQELEKKRLEYEELKRLRQANEQKMKELKRLEEEEALSRSISVDSEANLRKLASPLIVYTHDTPETIVHQQKEAVQDVNEEEDDEEDVPIKQLHIVVDEFELRKVESFLTAHDDHDNDNSSSYSLDVSNPDIAATSSFSEPDDFDKSLPTGDNSRKVDEFGIEEVADSPSLAKQLRPIFDPLSDQEPAPTFDLVPEVIADEPLPNLTPPVTNTAASIRSNVSSESRPIKSAMKQPKATYNSKASEESPAHQAYLSLTTAENTRLNSKLSNTQLADGKELVPDATFTPPKSPNNVLKRMSQTLRKQPSGSNPGGMSGRSLRPVSQIEQPQTLRANRTGNGGMSSRTFKPQPQPIAPHPVLQRNYQSPSKLKAADLYAKANSRPRSVFQPVRKSSFGKTDEQAKPESKRPMSQIQHRTTLRDSAQQNHASKPSQDFQAPIEAPLDVSEIKTGGRPQFKSRLADSDDEDAGSSHIQGGRGFSSRFRDSVEEFSRPAIARSSLSAEEVMRAPITSLRQKQGELEKEEKPKKKRFLKKLFGRN